MPVVRYDEVASGEIRHAIRFTVPQTRRTYVWPARHYASTLTDAQYPPMGQRFRLKASFDISGYSPQVQVILRAMKKYGIILADNGSSWFISGAPDERWNNTMLRELHKVLGSNFEAVDVSSLTINQDSGQAKTNIATPTPINTPRNTATATHTPTNTNTPTSTPTHTPTNTPTSIPPNSMTECVVTRSTATTATFASSHPKVLLNHQATKDCLKQLLVNGIPVATRFKNYVDTQLANGNQWNYQNWHTALIYQLTNDSKYAIDAVAKVDAYVASEEALISQGKVPEIAYDHYLHVG